MVLVDDLCQAATEDNRTAADLRVGGRGLPGRVAGGRGRGGGRGLTGALLGAGAQEFLGYG